MKNGFASGLFVLLYVSGLVSCISGVTQVRDTPTGGFLTYPIQSPADALTAGGRTEVLTIMQEKCPTGFRIVTEGEVPKVSSKADRAWRGQMSGERLWGVQYECK